MKTHPKAIQFFKISCGSVSPGLAKIYSSLLFELEGSETGLKVSDQNDETWTTFAVSEIAQLNFIWARCRAQKMKVTAT